MKRKFTFGVLWIVAGLTVIKAEETSVSKIFKKYEIEPDLISDAPGVVAKVVYPSGAQADLGNKLTPAETKESPSVTLHNDTQYYTLILADPDAPSPSNPTLRDFLHWTLVNIHGTDLASGEELAPYIGPAPPKGTGYHRYVFLVYLQPAPIEFHEPQLKSTSFDSRSNFDVIGFADKYKLGEPRAGNFFFAKWDETV